MSFDHFRSRRYRRLCRSLVGLLAPMFASACVDSTTNTLVTQTGMTCPSLVKFMGCDFDFHDSDKTAPRGTFLRDLCPCACASGVLLAPGCVESCCASIPIVASGVLPCKLFKEAPCQYQVQKKNKLKQLLVQYQSCSLLPSSEKTICQSSSLKDISVRNDGVATAAMVDR
jgi:hypothetical protein